MPSLKAIRTRIASVKNTQKITRAMKLVAAARLRRAQDAHRRGAPVRATRWPRRSPRWRCAPATTRTRCSTARAPKRVDAGAAHVRPRPGRRVQRQRDPRRRALHRRAKQATPPAREIALRDRRQEGARLLPPPQARPSRATTPAPTAATALADRARDGAHRRSHDFHERQASTRVYLVYNEFKTAVHAAGGRRAAACRSSAELAAGEKAAAAGALDYLYEPSKARPARRAAAAVRRVQIYRALLESIASELGARMTAMDNATNNAKEMIAIAHACSTTAPARRRSPRS